MFKTCFCAVAHELQSTDGKKISILSNAEPIEFTSGVTSLPSSREKEEGSNNDEFSPTQFFQRMNDLILENERYKKEESKYEMQCAQLLSKILNYCKM